MWRTDKSSRFLKIRYFDVYCTLNRERKPETYKDVIRRSQRLMKEMQDEIQEVRTETKQVLLLMRLFLAVVVVFALYEDF